MITKNLILLPGLMCDAAVWAPQLAALSKLAHCAVADYGLCDSLTDMALQVLESTQAANFALAGHSMGGRIALEMMRLAPQRITRLALLDTGTQPLAAGEAGEKERAGRMALVALAQQHGMRVMGRQWASGMVHPDVLGTPVFELVLHMLERSSPAQFAAQTRALLNRPDASTLLPHIGCKTLVLTGRDDLWSPPVQHTLMADAIGQAKLCIIEHCGHMSTLEQPEAVNTALAHWLVEA